MVDVARDTLTQLSSASLPLLLLQQRLRLRERPEVPDELAAPLQTAARLTEELEALGPELRALVEKTLPAPQETRRNPLPHEPSRIVREHIVVVSKLSSLEYGTQVLKLDSAAMRDKFESEGTKWSEILESHALNAEARELAQRLLSPEQVISPQKLSLELLDSATLVIALGGDGNLQQVSHYLDDTFLLGINSDPKRSEGALSGHLFYDLPDVLEKLESGDFQVEEWTRLSGELNGVPLALCTSEFFLGELERPAMSRGVLQWGGQEERQKSSGIVVATGTGSTGWYNSACRYLYPEGDQFPRTMRLARFVVTEPYHGKLSGHSLLEGQIGEDQVFTLTSLNRKGILRCDGIESYPFRRGDVAKIRIADTPLKVVSVEER